MSRVALSNLLNGSASLSRKMALRLKRAFGADADELLEIQAESESDQLLAEERIMAVRTYVPEFLMIKASQIEAWAEQDEKAPTHLPVLVRRLIGSTGRDLHEVDFPAYEQGQRPGWDGRVKAEAVTPWVPKGRSGWELSTSKRPRRKAESDFENRLAQIPAKERAETTFVFVTSRNWRNKNEWVERRREEGHWKDVRAFDASDLEQWLEESIAGQVWLAEQLDLPSVEDCMALDRAWERWAGATRPPLPKAMFAPAVRAHRDKFTSWLNRSDPERPFVVAADSMDEALAFLACLFWDKQVPTDAGDRAVVIPKAALLKDLGPAVASIIPIVADDEAERELVHGWRHAIAVRPRNAVDRKPDIELGLPDRDAFDEWLDALGYSRAEIDRLARESGWSPTILRRRLSRNDAFRRPRWAREPEARKLVPMSLVGTWHSGSTADCEVLSSLAGCRDVDQDFEDLRVLDDSPVWSVGEHRGVASQIDSLFAVARHMTRDHLDALLGQAERVLSEIDPALDLPPGERWLAPFHGEQRAHSDAIRTGLCETLVLLAVHGNDGLRLQERLGIDLQARVSMLVRRLLAPDGTEAPLTVEALTSYDRELPRLAEAAPDTFLELLEGDLAREPCGSALHELLKPAPPGSFADSPRGDVLRALERLAWNPRNLPRVVRILGRLSEASIDEDNWVAQPINSLKAIFWSGMPQTAADLDERFRALQLLAKCCPETAWQICVEQLRSGLRTTDYSCRPRWRGVATDAGEPVSDDERHEFKRRVLELLLEWPELNARRLGDLVELLGDASGKVGSEIVERVWALIAGWLKEGTEESERTALRERLRRFAFPRPARPVEPALRERTKVLYEQLAPRNPASRHAWLFAENWIDEWPDDFDGATGFSELEEHQLEEHRRKLRTDAMKDVWSAQGLTGALSLLSSSNAAWTVGAFVSRCVTEPCERRQVIRDCLAGQFDGLDLEKDKVDGFLCGFLEAEERGSRKETLGSLGEELPREQIDRLLLCAPFDVETWRFVNGQDDDVRKTYWREVNPCALYGGVLDEELTELIDSLLDARRPRAAFLAVHMRWDSVETSRLKRLLHGIVAGGRESDRSVQIGRYGVRQAVESLNKRRGITVREMSNLELVLFEYLERENYGIPNLERRIGEDPDYFVRLVALAYQRTDGGEDPEGWSVPDLGDRVDLGWLARLVLEKCARIPGAEAREGEFDGEHLGRWVSEARRLGELCGRAEVVDEYVGRLLSQEVRDGLNPWPSPLVCKTMQNAGSGALANGFFVGVRTSRGVVFGEGGAQERELAARYRARAKTLAFEFPFVSEVLERIAKSYDREAGHWDTESVLRQRMEI